MWRFLLLYTHTPALETSGGQFELQLHGRFAAAYNARRHTSHDHVCKIYLLQQLQRLLSSSSAMHSCKITVGKCNHNTITFNSTGLVNSRYIYNVKPDAHYSSPGNHAFWRTYSEPVITGKVVTNSTFEPTCLLPLAQSCCLHWLWTLRREAGR